MRAPVLLACLVAALAPPGARAVEPVLAARLGVAAAMGSAARDVPVTDVVPVQFPLQLDALLRGGPLALGVYYSIALGYPGRCDGASCRAQVERAGLQGTWTFTTGGGLEPWLGLATGYEWVSEDRTRGGTITTRYRGFEPFAAQGGLEWRAVRWLALGPYALVSLGRYTRYSVDTGYQSGTVRVPDPAVHAWFHVGVRGRLVPGGAP